MTSNTSSKWTVVYRAWLVWLFGALFYCYQFVLRVSPNIMTDELMQHFSIEATALGMVIAFYYYAYAGMQIPLGVMMDMFGPRRLLSIAGMVCAAGCWIFATSTSPALASLARFMIGLGSACGFLGCCKLITVWFPPQKVSFMIGLTVGAGTIGATVGGAPLELLVNQIGWQTTIKTLGVIGASLSLLILVFAKYSPPEQTTTVTGDESEEDHFLSGLLQVISNPQAWLIAVFGMLMYIPLPIVGDLWGVSFIEKIYYVDEKIAATIIATMFIGIALGSPFFAMLSERLNSRRTPMIIGAAVTLTVYVLVIYAENIPLPFMYLLFLCAGIFFTGQCLCFSSICELMPLSTSGVAIGFTNMLIMISGVLGHHLGGWLLDISRHGATIAGIPVYSADDFRFALSIIPICLGIALLLTQFIRETHPGHHH